MINAYWKYFVYILNHKLTVWNECRKEGLYVQGILHDLSKFSPAEFFPYAKKFYSVKPLNVDDELRWKYAWLRHQRKNKHHWEYWVINPNTNEALPMPKKYMIEMVCDWRSFSRKWGRKVNFLFINLLIDKRGENFEKTYSFINISDSITSFRLFRQSKVNNKGYISSS